MHLGHEFLKNFPHIQMAGNLDSQTLLELVAHSDDPLIKSDAVDRIYQRYLGRLINLAHQRLSVRLRQRLDAEDIVQSAFRSFFLRAEQGKFKLAGSGGLWRLLATITIKKVYRNVERHSAQRRDVGRESRVAKIDHASTSVEPTPEEVVALIDLMQHFLSTCDAQTRTTIELRLQGVTIPEIAEQIGRSERTVRRTLNESRIRLENQLIDEP